jgi:outer membrane translocation and assembly module TamA
LDILPACADRSVSGGENLDSNDRETSVIPQILRNMAAGISSVSGYDVISFSE